MKTSTFIKALLSFRDTYKTVNQQKELIQKIGDANTYLDRSYKQYICQRFMMPPFIKIINDFISIILAPILILFYSLKGIICFKSKKCYCIGDLKGWEEIIPNSLLNQYTINNDVWFSGSFLKLSDTIYIYKIFIKHPFSPSFLFKIILKIARYSYMIKTYSAKVIIVHNEYSFTSSILTDYCHISGVKHINVMHGEKVYSIRESYVCYDKFFVWDEYYANLFKSLYAEPSQFIIEKPISMAIPINLYKDPKYFADYKYYLTGENKDQLYKIMKFMEFAKNEGKTVKYRPHPRYSYISLVEKIVGTENIEYPNKTNILISISNCGCVVGCSSTVLNQAYNSGVPVILDDLSDAKKFNMLKEKEYIMINKGLTLLSEKQ